MNLSDNTDFIITQTAILEFDNFDLSDNILSYIQPNEEKTSIILETCVLRLVEINTEEALKSNLVFLYKTDNLSNRRFLQRMYFIENAINKLLKNEKGIATTISKDKTIRFFITNDTLFFKNNQNYEPIRTDVKSLYKNALCKCLVKISPISNESENYSYSMELVEIVIA